MKERKMFLSGLLVILLAMGLVLANCGDNGDPDGNGGNNSGGTNSGGTNSGGTNTGGTNSGGTNTGGTNTGGTNSGGSENTTPSKPSYVKGAGYVTRLYIYWSIYPTPQNIVIEAWRPSTRSWTTIETLSGSESNYNFTGYNSYITGDSNGPQGLYDERKAVFVRVRGKNGTTLGPAKAIMFDTLYGDTIEDLLPVYEN